MLEKTNIALQNYINNSYSVETTPKAVIEINGNEYGKPYFIGTDTRKSGGSPQDIFNSMKMTLTARPGTLSPTSSSNHAPISLTTSGQSVNLNAGPGDNAWFTQTSQNTKSAKFNMFLKSNPGSGTEFEYLNSFNVVITATGLNSSGQVVRSEVVTENIFVDNVDWVPVSIAFSNPDQFNLVDRVRLEISISVEPGKRAGLIVSQLCYADISEYEVFVRNRLPIEKIFETNRPGDFLTNIPLASRPKQVFGSQTIYQQCTSVHIPMAYALGTKYEKLQRSVTPYKDNPFIYYVSGSDLSSKRIWAFYQNIVKTNKLVIKFNTIAFKPGIYTVELLTSSGWVSINSPQIDASGICTLYYRNGQWSTTPWTNSEFPVISTSGNNAGRIISNISGSEQIGEVSIYGIALNVATMSVNNTDFSDLSKDYYTQRLEVIEISPRLELDVSQFIQNVSIVKETDSENTFLNIGGVSSNSANITLSNILITKTFSDALTRSETNDVRPISSVSSTSPLYGIINRGAKVKLGFIIKSPTETYVPSFYGEIDKWTEGYDTISISCFDLIKKMQSTKVAPLYLRANNVIDAISAILDSTGFGDVYFQELYNLKMLSERDGSSVGIVPDERIPYFWTDKDRTVSESLEDLFKIYQIAMYVDEYGGVKFESLYNYNIYYSQLTSSTPTKSPDLFVQDKDDISKNIKSNLISSSVEENEIAKNITIKYKVPKPSMSEPVAKKNKTKDEKKKEVKNSKNVKEEDKEYIIKQSTNIVWNIQDESVNLPFIRIAREGITGISQNYIPYDVSQTESLLGAIPYSSELLIDDEIVSYEGIEFEFRYRTAVSGQVKKTIERVMNPSELQTIQAELIRKGAIILELPNPTGKLLNVKRGLYGTSPAIHTKKTSSSLVKWKAREFSKSNSSYTNATLANSNVVRVEGGLILNVNNPNKLIYLTPDDTEDDSEILRNKKRLSVQFKISDIKSGKDGFFGVGIGTKISSGKLTEGILIFIGVEENKDKNKPVVWVEQIVDNGNTIKQLISKDEFSYADDLIEEDENIELFVSLNKKRDECTVLVGGTTIFEKVEEDSDKNKKKDKKKTSFKLSKPLSGSGSFGFIGRGSGASAIMGQFLFGNSISLEDLNDLDIDSVNDSYTNPVNGKTDPTYFIGNSNLLDNIVSYQLISGNLESSKDNFAWFGTPVARGIRVFDIDYESFPVISVPEVVYTGYTYELEVFESANIFSDFISRVE